MGVVYSKAISMATWDLNVVGWYGLRPLTIFAVESRIAGFGWFTYSSTPNISYEKSYFFPKKYDLWPKTTIMANMSQIWKI